MRKLLFAAIATLMVTFGTLAAAGTASAQTSNALSPNAPINLYSPVGG